MAEREGIDRLEQALQSMLAGATPSLGETPFSELVRIAATLREMPREAFRRALKDELLEAARPAWKERTMTGVKAVPEGFRTVTPYLRLQGAAEMIDFLKQAFGATEAMRFNRPDGTIMHAQVHIGDSVLELADSDPSPVALHLYVPDADSVYAKAVAAGALGLYAPRDQPYGDREGTVRDHWGNNWYIATHRAGTSHKPEGLGTLTPYLHPHGTSAFIDFLRSALHAEVIQRHDSPEGTVVHAKLRIGDAIVEMGEAHGEWQPMPALLHVYVDDADAWYRRAIAAGARSLAEPTDQPYGERSGAIIDPQGNHWYLATRTGELPGS